MTPFLVFATFLFGIMVSGNKKVKRGIESFENEKEGLKEVFPDVGEDRKVCRYYFSGDLDSVLICDNEFECKDCGVHKRFIKKVFFLDESKFFVKDVRGLNFSPCIFYHRGHSCIYICRNGVVLIGIDSFILNIIGKRVNKVVLPEEGDFVEAGEIGFSLIFNDQYFPVLSPISGQILQINENMLKDIKLNKTFVWFCAVKPFDLGSELQSLLSGKEAEEWLKYELNAFKEKIFSESEFAADGGEINFSSLDFDKNMFVKNFLLSFKK